MQTKAAVSVILPLSVSVSSVTRPDLFRSVMVTNCGAGDGRRAMNADQEAAADTGR